MKLMGFNFKKINIEKFKDKYEKLKINNKIDITSILEITPEGIDKSEKILKVEFFYGLEYSPDIAKIEFNGSIFLSVEEKLVKNILKEWENKKISNEFKLAVFNVILKKSSIKALELEEELNLPLHISMPSLKKSVEE